MMKRIFTPILFLLLGSQAFGQYTYGEPVESGDRGGAELKKTRFGLFIAPNSSWMKPTASKATTGCTMLPATAVKWATAGA